MDAFPAFLPLTGRTVMIVGTGEAADAKARLFEGSPADVIRHLNPETADYTGAALVFIALPDGTALNRALLAARQSGALVNVVDHPDLSDFTTPSIVDRGTVVGAIGTGGASPVLATRLRQQLETLWPPGLGDLATLLRARQGKIRERWPDLTERRAFLRRTLDGEIAKLALAGDLDRAAARLDAVLSDAADAGAAQAGGVFRLMVGGTADDLTLAALRRIGSADRIAIEGEVPAEIVAFARRDAPRQLSPGQDELNRWAEAGEAVCVLVRRRDDQDEVRS